MLDILYDIMIPVELSPGASTIDLIIFESLADMFEEHPI